MRMKRLVDNLPAPQRESDGAAGYDLRAAVGGEIWINAGERKLVETGFIWEIPKGYVGLVRPRSGHAVKKGIDVMAGVIDSDYRGEVKVLLVNHSDKAVALTGGDRIAQMVVVPHYDAPVIEVDALDDTERGEGGFGSTGN